MNKYMEIREMAFFAVQHYNSRKSLLDVLNSLFRNHKKLEETNPQHELLRYVKFEETGRKIKEPDIAEEVPIDFSYDFNEDLNDEFEERYDMGSDYDIFIDAPIGGLERYNSDLKKEI